MMREKLSAPVLYQTVRESFSQIPDHRAQKNVIYPLVDILSSSLAIFLFKFQSLLKFIEKNNDPFYGHNVKTLFQVTKIPSETQLRDIIDPVNPELLRPTYDKILSNLQRGNVLKNFTVLGLYPIALDGTGYFSSSNTHCPQCLVKKSRSQKDDEYTYHHQMLAASIVHPIQKQVIPLFPEPIMNHDGSLKNDCERNASARWIFKFRQHHPKMPALILEDSLASNVPHLKVLKENDCRYVTGAKESDHKYLFEQFKINSVNSCTEKFQETIYAGEKVKRTTTRTYEFISDLEINKTHTGFKTNFIYFTEVIKTVDAKGRTKEFKTNFSWVTDLELKEKDLPLIVATARRRWGIENENFQTLKKTTDYSLEHNYGHGKEFLAINFAVLCILAFLIDQVQEIACSFFKEMLAKAKSKRTLWEDMRSAIAWNLFQDWEHYMQLMRKRFLDLDTT